jgi:predicted MPP superfamily phosphohydrolase
MRIFIFIGIVSFFLYIANLVIYEAVADIFTITTQWQLIILGGLLAIFSANFIGATILGTYYYNTFTRTYYVLAAVWIGLCVYLFFASTLFGVLVMLPVSLPTTNVGMALMTAALLVSVYGFFHSRNIRIVETEISLANLPASWRGKKAIWISDLHLGQLQGPAFARKVVDTVNALPHDIIFIGGDLFDGTGAPDINELVAPLKDFRAPLGTYFITGNHEEFGDSGRFIAAVKSVGIRVLLDEKVDIEGLQLVGVDYHNASDKEQFKTILSKLSLDPQKPSLLLKHEPKDLDVAEEADISIQISGHTHRAQLWPLEYVAQLTYKGYAYGLKKFKNMQVFTSSGTGTWGPPMRVGTNSEIIVITFAIFSESFGEALLGRG